jgi:2-polyprenyl-3-methyl-5-hydroxy-6-metoxy-1,4-benzoquinol methylase
MRVKRDFSREDWDDYYRRYQKVLAREYLIPILKSWGVELNGKMLLEVGCGNGGCGAEFSAAGCRVVMMDLDRRLVAFAASRNDEEAVPARTFVGNIMEERASFWNEGPYDIVMFRDVMEHIEDPVAALRAVRDHLAPRGVVLVVFPPYYSPFGAHQQIAPRKTLFSVPYNKLPYLQMLPRRLFLSIVEGETAAHAEVNRLSGIRLTIRKFERSVREGGFVVKRRKMFLSRPSFALRYGIPVIEAGPLGGIPILNEALVTAAYYLIGPDAGAKG